jgi:predicted PurR-regulated permease PerM
MSTHAQPPEDGDAGSPAEPVFKLSTPIDVRSTSLAVLATIALIVFLRWAQEVLIPITFAVLLSYALTPVVGWLKRKAGLHQALGAALTLTLLLGLLGVGLNSLQPEAINILDIVPRATQKLTAAMRGNQRSPASAVAKIQKAASEIEKAANAPASPTTPAAAAPVKPAPEAPFRVRDYILMGTASVVAGIGQLVVIVALVYFLLIAGDTFRRKLVPISGDTLSKKKITVTILDEIVGQIQRYLLVQIATSALLGVVAWAVFALVGLDNALTWACIGGVLHLIPYAGPAAFIALIALVAYVQFDTLQPVVVILGSLLASVGVIGMLLVPWLTHKVGSLNAVTVFIALLIWGWLWGVWGLLLGVPIMMAVKAVCDRIEELQPISAFLGNPVRKAPADDGQPVGNDSRSIATPGPRNTRA